MPTLIAATWGDAIGGYVWGGLVARVMGEPFLLDDHTAYSYSSSLVWHCTFLVNSLVIPP
jgi:stearoyl-CoA desaturase (Delta-9 desaturase)